MSAPGPAGPPVSPFERLRAALASAVPGGGAGAGGIGCHFWIHPTLGIAVEQLEALGLVRTIRQRIPACEEHGCALLDACAWQRVFAEKQPGRSGRKFMLTALGSHALERPTVLAERVAEQPIARRILEVVREAGGALGWPELYWRLLEPELAELDDPPETRPARRVDRAAVRFYLDLLVGAGLLTEDRAAGTVALAG